MYKNHPCDKATYGDCFNEYYDRSIPFESICCASQMSEKIIITLTSTAVLTPKLILNEEPGIILLYRLFNLKMGSAPERDLLYTEFRKEYTNKNLIHIPCNMDELFVSIKQTINL